MFDIRKKERLLYAKCQLLKSLVFNEKLKKEKAMEIGRKIKETKKKHLFFQNYIIANEKIKKEEN